MRLSLSLIVFCVVVSAPETLQCEDPDADTQLGSVRTSTTRILEDKGGVGEATIQLPEQAVKRWNLRRTVPLSRRMILDVGMPPGGPAQALTGQIRLVGKAAANR